MKEKMMKHNTPGVQQITTNLDIYVTCIQLNNPDISIFDIYL